MGSIDGKTSKPDSGGETEAGARANRVAALDQDRHGPI